MEHLCIGSYARIMTSCAITAERRFDSFSEKIMLSLCADGAGSFSYVTSKGDIVDYDYTNFNKLLAGKQNLPSEVMQMALAKDKRMVEHYFINTVIPALDEGRKKNAVLALKNIILRDRSIDDSTQLGTVAELTKEELKTKNEFVLSEFLTDIFLYAVTKTNNLEETTFTKSITKEFYAAYNPGKDTITLYEPVRPKASAAIPLTGKGKNFSKVFTSVSSEKLKEVTSKQDLQIFCLKLEDRSFDYTGLWKYLRNNIGYYVYSRAQIQKYIDNDEIGSIAYDAIDQLKKASKGGVLSGEELGELLLYVFLEQVLKAPKFMSRVELNNYGGFNVSKSAGIHILTTESPLPFNQIVFGTSMIEGSLQAAIDDAFSKAKELEKRKKDERRFVETKIFTETFTKEVADVLESIILPTENGTKKPDTAFGMFAGYSIVCTPTVGISSDAFQEEVLRQIKNDIINSVPYIESRVTQYGLDGYSLYIYILPFIDADEDKKNIMDKLLQAGGDTL
jgi:hypothetical protein